MQHDQAGINRDQNPEEQDQKRTKIIPDGPVSENTGSVPAPNGSGSHNNGPEGMPQVYTKGGYTIPDVLGDVSLGIERDTVGFTLTFYRNGGKVGSHTTKTPPWLSPKVLADTGAALLKVCPDLGKVYAKEHVRDTLTEVFQTVADSIQTNPQAAALLMPPVVSHVLERVERVVITRYKDGFGGGEPIYELFSGLDEDADQRVVTMSLGDMVHEGPGMFKRRWSAVFVSEFLELNKTDWVTLRSALIDRAEVRDSENIGLADALISELLEELSFRTFTELKDLWKSKTENYLLCELKDGEWGVMVSTRLIVSFLKRRDYDPEKWTPKLSKELKNRNITTRTAKTVRVGTGTLGTVRVWVFSGDALGFNEDLLWERSAPPGQDNFVTGENSVTGDKPHHTSQPEKEEFSGQGQGGA